MFINIISNIYPKIKRIITWIKQLGYFKKWNQYIKSYYLIISDKNKVIIEKIMQIDSKRIIKFIILIVTNTYSINIANLNIKLIIY